MMPRRTRPQAPQPNGGQGLAEQARRLQEAIRRFNIKVLPLMNNALSRGHLNLPQYNALNVLVERGRATMGELTEALCLSTAGATNVVDRLVQLGLAERRRDPRDRRVVLVSPTAKGRRAVQRIRRDVGVIFRRLLAGLSPEQRRVFVRICERVSELVWQLPLEARG